MTKCKVAHIITSQHHGLFLRAGPCQSTSDIPHIPASKCKIFAYECKTGLPHFSPLTSALVNVNPAWNLNSASHSLSLHWSGIISAALYTVWPDLPSVGTSLPQLK